MKINNTFITQLRSFSLHPAKGQPRPFIYPLREWAVCLFVTLCAAIGLFGYAGFDFNRQLNERNDPLLTEERIPRYSEEEAESIIRYYEGRLRTFDVLRSNRVVGATQSQLPSEGTTEQ